MESKEVVEMAWGMCNNQPFLWVVRPGSILGSDGIETLPNEVSTIVSERGYIVKRAQQIEVLRHPAVGGFCSQCGWNSTLESNVKGTPLICRPFKASRRAVKRLIVNKEGAEMKKASLTSGGSSYNALDEFVKYLKTK
ncbi:hypothetical protein N665_0127s0021 [Sinapis alba]|nr:hypothetical protein N665_0127s0021 [Sinapis alba]